jgi:hypothetical protein
MFCRKFDVHLAVLTLSHTLFAAWSSEPRKSPELTLTQPSGAEIRLSSFKDKVIAIEFLFVRSPHCLQLAEMLNKLNSELGPQGFQPLAVAFGPNAEPGALTHLMDYFKITYPVGYTTTDKVDAYLTRNGKEVLKIPQIVIVDRHGFIRASSGREGDPTLEHESSSATLSRRCSMKALPGQAYNLLRVP